MSSENIRTGPSEANAKAWAYLRELMNDDEKFFALKVKNEPVDVKGSEGGRYILYPSGKVVIIGKSEAKLGKTINEDRIAHPDILSTLWVWITQKELEFLKNWQCGNLSVLYQGRDTHEELGYIEVDLADVNEHLRVRRRRYRAIRRHHWYDDIEIPRVSAKLLFILMTIPLLIFAERAGYIDLGSFKAFFPVGPTNSTVTQPVHVNQTQTTNQPQEAKPFDATTLLIIFIVVIFAVMMKKMMEEVI